MRERKTRHDMDYLRDMSYCFGKFDRYSKRCRKCPDRHDCREVNKNK